MLEAGLLSSKYPFPAFSVSLPTLTEAPRFATPCIHTTQQSKMQMKSELLELISDEIDFNKIDLSKSELKSIANEVIYV